MKKIIILFISAFLLLSCSSSPHKIMEKKVTKLVKDNIDDPKSYESVSFSKIDTIWTNFDDSPQGKDIAEKYHDATFNLHNNELYLNDDEAKKIYPNAIFADSIVYYQHLSDSLKPIYDKQLSDFIEEPKLFYIKHIFRANNKFGALIKDDITVYFDKDLNITGTDK